MSGDDVVEEPCVATVTDHGDLGQTPFISSFSDSTILPSIYKYKVVSIR